MKKVITVLGLVLCTISQNHAQVTDLLSFGSGSFSIDGGSTMGSLNQNASGITMTAAPVFGETWYNSSLTPLVSDWTFWSSNPNFFGVRMSLTNANPNIAFSVLLQDSGGNDIATYSGSTVGLTTTPSVVALSLASAGSLVFTNIGFVNFTWGGNAGSVNTTVTEFVGVVPEPSTYALLAISAAAFGGYVIRRRKRA
jgi:hypothetical protein